MSNRQSYNDGYHSHYNNSNNFYALDDNYQWPVYSPNNYRQQSDRNPRRPSSGWYQSPNQHNQGERYNYKINKNKYKKNNFDKSQPKQTTSRFDSRHKHQSRKPFHSATATTANDKKSLESEPTSVGIEPYLENETKQWKKVEEEKIRLKKVLLSSETLPSMNINNSPKGNSSSDENNKEVLPRRELCLTLPTLELTESDYKEIGALTGQNLQDEEYSGDENREGGEPLFFDVSNDNSVQSVLDEIQESSSNSNNTTAETDIKIANELPGELVGLQNESDENLQDHNIDVTESLNDNSNLQDRSEVVNEQNDNPEPISLMESDENLQDHNIDVNESINYNSNLQERSEVVTEENDNLEVISLKESDKILQDKIDVNESINYNSDRQERSEVVTEQNDNPELISLKESDKNLQDHNIDVNESINYNSNRQEISEFVTEQNNNQELISLKEINPCAFSADNSNRSALENKTNNVANSSRPEINNYNIVQDREMIIGYIDRNVDQRNVEKFVEKTSSKSETQSKIYGLYKSFLKYRRYGASNVLKDKMLKLKGDNTTANPFLSKDYLTVILKQIATETKQSNTNKEMETSGIAEQAKLISSEELDQTQNITLPVQTAEKDVDEFMENYGHLLDDNFTIPNQVLQQLGLSDYLEELAFNETSESHNDETLCNQDEIYLNEVPIKIEIPDLDPIEEDPYSDHNEEIPDVAPIADDEPTEDLNVNVSDNSNDCNNDFTLNMNVPVKVNQPVESVNSIQQFNLSTEMGSNTIQTTDIPDTASLEECINILINIEKEIAKLHDVKMRVYEKIKIKLTTSNATTANHSSLENTVHSEESINCNGTSSVIKNKAKTNLVGENACTYSVVTREKRKKKEIIKQTTFNSDVISELHDEKTRMCKNIEKNNTSNTVHSEKTNCDGTSFVINNKGKTNLKDENSFTSSVATREKRKKKERKEIKQTKFNSDLSFNDPTGVQMEIMGSNITTPLTLNDSVKGNSSQKCSSGISKTSRSLRNRQLMQNVQTDSPTKSVTVESQSTSSRKAQKRRASESDENQTRQLRSGRISSNTFSQNCKTKKIKSDDLIGKSDNKSINLQVNNEEKHEIFNHSSIDFIDNQTASTLNVNTEIKNCYVNLSHSIIPANIQPNDYVDVKVKFIQCDSKKSRKPSTRSQQYSKAVDLSNDNMSADFFNADNLFSREDLSFTDDMNKLNISCIKVYKNELFMGCENGKTLRLKEKTPRLIHTYLGHNGSVSSIDFFDKHMVTGSHDQHIIVHDLIQNKTVARISVEEPIQTIHIKWGKIFVGTKKGTIATYSTAKKTELLEKMVVGKPDDIVLDIYAAKEGPRKILIVSTKLGTPAIRDATSGLLLRTFQFTDVFYSIAFRESTPLVYCGTRNNSVVVVDFTTGQKVNSLHLGKSVIKVIIKWDIIFTASYDGKIHVYSLTENKLIAEYSIPEVIIEMEIWENMIVVATSKLKPAILNFPPELYEYINLDSISHKMKSVLFNN